MMRSPSRPCASAPKQKAGVAAEQVAGQADAVNGDDDDGNRRREPGAGVDAAVLPRQQQLQRQCERDGLADRIDGDPHDHAVMPEYEERQSGKTQSGDQRGVTPVDRAVVETVDAHGAEAGGENQRGAAGEQRHQRIHRDDAQHRERRAAGRRERRAGPEPCRFESGIAAHDVGPDQAKREKVDDEHRP
jgi:hypothetical protein